MLVLSLSLLGCKTPSTTTTPTTGCEPGATHESSPGPLAAELGITELRVSDAGEGTIEVEVVGASGPLGTAWVYDTLEDRPEGLLRARLETADGGTVTLDRRTGWIGAGEEAESLEDAWVADGVPLSTRVGWADDDSVEDVLWSTPAREGEAAPEGGFVWSAAGEDAWGVRSVDTPDAWLADAGLTDGWARAELLHAVVADELVWGVDEAEGDCSEEASRVPPPAGCEAAMAACVSAMVRCQETTTPGTRAHRRACATATARCGRVPRVCRQSAQSTLCTPPYDDTRCRAVCGNNRGYCDMATSTCQCPPEIPCNPYAGLPVERAAGQSETCSACGEGEGCSAGDPHLVSFDRTFFDYQGAGEFVLARSSDGAFEVQARTVGWASCRGFATNERIAVRAGGARVEVMVDGDRVTVDGEPVADGDGVSRGGARITRIDPDVVVESPEGDRVTASLEAGQWLDVTVSPSPSRRGTMSGLLGDMDGDGTDDFRSSDGYVPAGPIDADYLRWAFGPSWRVTDTTSLFTYGPGESTATWTDESFSPTPGPEDLPQETRAEAEAACAGTGVSPELFDACVVDVACGGGGTTFFEQLGPVEAAAVEPAPYADPCGVAMAEPEPDADGTVRFTCLPGCGSGPCWGTDVYTGDSSICTSAMHAGRVGPGGGLVAYRPATSANHPGSTRNGVSCGSWGAYEPSFSFVDP